MLGLALGSFLIGRIVDRLKDVTGVFIYVEICIGLYALLMMLIFSKLDIIFLRLFFRFNDSFTTLFASFFLAFFILLLIPTTLMGATMPLVSRIFTRSLPEAGHDIGMVFSSNTFGGIFGSLSAGFILIPLLGTEKTILSGALLNIAAGAMLFKYSKLRKETFYGLFATFIFITAAFSSYAIDPLIGGAYYQGIWQGGLEEYKDDKRQTVILFQKEDPNGFVTVVTRPDGPTTLQINGKADASDRFDIPTEYMLAYAPLMLHPNPVNILNIGLGAGFTLSAIEDFDEVRSIDVLEINPAVIEATVQEFSESNDDALGDPRLKLVVGDARNMLLVNEKKYDVIISEPSNPWLAGESGLFTQEFYWIAKNRLNKGGIFTQWIPLYDLSGRDLQVHLNTFHSVFPYVNAFVIGGGDMILVGSLDDLAYDYPTLKKRFDYPAVKRHFTRLTLNAVAHTAVPEPIEYFFSFYFMDPLEIKEYIVDEGELNSDDKPIMEFNTAVAHFMTGAKVERSLQDVLKFKVERQGAIATSPQIINHVTIGEQRDVFELFGIEVNKGVDWSLKDVGYGFIFFPESGVYNILRSFSFHTEAGDLSWIKVDNVPLGIPDVGAASVITQSQMVSLTMLEPFEKDGGAMFMFTDGNRLYGAWQCGEPNLNILILSSQDLETARDVFGRVSCI
jgi:spermidine synthase